MAGKKLTNLAIDTAAAGDIIDKSSQKLGLSAEAYQEWDYVLSQSGVDIESAGMGFKTLTNQIDSAKKGSKEAQERLPVSRRESLSFPIRPKVRQNMRT